MLYAYPGADELDFPEVYVKLGRRGAGLEAWYSDASYKDNGIALSRGFGNFNFMVQASGTDVDPAYSPIMDDIKVLIGVSTTLPWGSD